MKLADEMKALTQKGQEKNQEEKIRKLNLHKEKLIKAKENGAAWGEEGFKKALVKIRERAANGETGAQIDVAWYPEDRPNSEEYDISMAFFNAIRETLRHLLLMEGFSVSEQSYTYNYSEDGPNGTQLMFNVRW